MEDKIISLEDKKRERKVFLISLAISFATSILVTVGSFFMMKGRFETFQDHKWIILTDTFTFTSVLFLVIFALVKLSDFGAFDAIVYSVKLVVTVTFHKDVRKTKLPSSYREYRELKQAKKRVNATFILFTAIPYILLTIAFLITYLVTK